MKKNLRLLLLSVLISGNIFGGLLYLTPLKAVISSFVDTYSTQFNGTNQSAISSGNAYNFESTDSFSCSFWARTTVGGAIFSTLNVGIHRGWNVVAYDAGAGMVMALGLSNNESTSLLVVQTSNSFTTNVWHHWAVTYSGNGSPTGIKIYKDGSVEATDTPVNTLSGTIVSNSNLIFGTHMYGGFYNGYLDEIAFFSGSVLSSGNVTTLYNSGHPGNLASFSPLPTSWWRMGDGDTSPILIDQMAFVNMTMQNMSQSNFVTSVP